MRVEINDRVMTWVLDRPARQNGIDEPTMAEMARALDILEEAGSDIGCLRIAGDAAVFSTGLDGALLETCFADRARFAAVVARSNDIFDRIEALPLVTLACVEGECRLGGLELALACDLIVAGADARFCDGHLAYDAMPGGGATKRLPRRLGYGGALRFILLAPTLDGRAAAEVGLVDEVVPAGDALRRGVEIATAVARRDRALIASIKACLRSAAPAATDRSYRDAFQHHVIERLVGEP